ncbi:MAG: hypothetical protein ACRYGO_07275 [Janthinobacterium lividum]
MFDQTNNTASTLADLEARDTAWLEVQNKQDDGPLLFNGKPVRIEVRSPGTREALGAQHKLEQAQTAKTFAAMRGKPVKETIDDKLTSGAEKLAAVTASIDGLPVTPIELYKNPRLGYIAEQVQRFHGDWSNF